MKVFSTPQRAARYYARRLGLYLTGPRATVVGGRGEQLAPSLSSWATMLTLAGIIEPERWDAEGLKRWRLTPRALDVIRQEQARRARRNRGRREMDYPT